jgi:cellulose synthase/poly-beta-1,6-N-acetylglucosamine synthase-like glycosyltransferase
MSALSIFILVVHFSLLLLLCLFGLHRLSMVARWVYHRRIKLPVPKIYEQFPSVTVQIPLYNERLVAKRIVDATAALEYPSERLQIQIVDDSTDATAEIIAERVAYYQQQGLNISHVHRTNRQGYKAGALKEAMNNATGEFIAIFDADFIPNTDTLINNIHQFTDEKLGMVQFRWEHLNRNNSQLTKTQAIMLDAHFSLEQHVRCVSDYLFNFNGTAGIWRTATIIDAGHWSADTLTEDLDLSYRAQLAGWKMLYLNEVVCPGEIPADMNAFKSQQYRWAKGGVEVMLKMLPTVWRSKISFKAKIESTFHLSNNLAYLVMLTDTLLFLVPSLWLREKHDFLNIWWIDIPLLLLSSGGHLVYLYSGQVVLGHSKWKTFLKLPNLVLLGIQLAMNNSRAGIEALMGKKSEFIRTPKSGDMADIDTTNTVSKNSVEAQSINIQSIEAMNALETPETLEIAEPVSKLKTYKAVAPKGALFELLVSVIYVIVFLWAIKHEHWFMLPFLSLLAIGFFTTAIESLRSSIKLS